MNWTEPIGPAGFPAYPRWYWVFSLSAAAVALIWVAITAWRGRND